MSAYVYAIIPYKSGLSFTKDEPCQYCWNPKLSELYEIDSEYSESDGLYLYSDFLLVNTCCRQSVFTDNKDDYYRFRAEIYQMAKALGAHEAWYVEELITDEIDKPDFSFDNWVNNLKTEKKHLVAELTDDLIKSKEVFSYYHDDFSDLVKYKAK